MSKKLIILGITLILVLFTIGCQKQVDIDAEKAAIKKVLQAQLDAFKNVSYEGEASVWAHKPYIVGKKTVSWDSISAHYQTEFPDMKKLIEEDPDNHTIKEFTASNFDIYVNGTFAASFHDEYMEYIWEGKESNNKYRTLKYLEKINGEWKVIAISLNKKLF